MRFRFTGQSEVVFIMVMTLLYILKRLKFSSCHLFGLKRHLLRTVHFLWAGGEEGAGGI